MKSIIQNGKTVEQTVAAAWEAAGRPEEFSVKILDNGERGFLGFTKRLAIISFTYDDRRPERTDRRRGGQPQRRARERFEVRKNDSRPMDQKKRPQSRRPEEPKREEKRELPKQTSGESEPNVWTEDYAQAAVADLSKMLNLIGSPDKVSHEIQDKSLTLNIGMPVLDEISSERTLCASFSYLILQSIKRQFRKKLRGFRLRIEPSPRKKSMGEEPSSATSTEDNKPSN